MRLGDVPTCNASSGSTSPNNRQTDKQTDMLCLMVLILYMVWGQVSGVKEEAARPDTTIELFLTLDDQNLLVTVESADAVNQVTSFVKSRYGEAQRFSLTHNGRALKASEDPDLVNGDTVRVFLPLLGGAEEPQDTMRTPHQGSGGGTGGK